MPTISKSFLERLHNYDPSIAVLWNQKIHRWVVCQFLPQPRAVTKSLRGVPGIDGAKSHYKFLFSCETEERLPDDKDRGIPLEPSDWIIETLAKQYPPKQVVIDPNAPFGDAYQKAEQSVEEQDNAEYLRIVNDIAQTTARDMYLYGGDSKYSVDSSPRRKHFNAPSKIYTEDDL